MINFLLVFAVVCLPTSFRLQEADCDDEDFLDECAEQIAGFKFMKANKVSISGSDSGASVELSSVFSKGTSYVLTACSGGPNMIVTLYDRRRKKIMSNYNRGKKKYYPSIKYNCKATGVYYLKYEFEKGGAGCGVGIVGFKKN